MLAPRASSRLGRSVRRRRSAPRTSGGAQTSGGVLAVVDGNLKIMGVNPARQVAVVKGDGHVACIAAASILAKVHRDRCLHELDAQYPQYGFAQHKGYPAPSHIEAIRQYGLCPEHRRSFKPKALESVQIPIFPL